MSNLAALLTDLPSGFWPLASVISPPSSGFWLHPALILLAGGVFAWVSRRAPASSGGRAAIRRATSSVAPR